MMPASGNGCICSSCFTRSYDFYNDRTLMGRKKGVLRPLGPPCPDEIDKRWTMWKKYLARRTERKVKIEAEILIARKRKMFNMLEEESEFVNEIPCSEVFLESPTHVDGRVPITNLNQENFWDFVYQQKWKGRLRVCEGKLMYKLTETLKKLVSMGLITNFNVTRLFASENTEFGDDITMYKHRDSTFVVRVDQTYYGGTPRKPKKVVTFNLKPNSVFRSRLKRKFLPILKRDTSASTDIAGTKSLSVPRVENKVPSFASSAKNSHQQKNLIPDTTKDDFASICLKATQDFVVAKEIITNSRTLKSSTSFTLRTKEPLSGTNEIAVTMREFYTSSSLPEHSYKSPEFKPGTHLLEMAI